MLEFKTISQSFFENASLQVRPLFVLVAVVGEVRLAALCHEQESPQPLSGKLVDAYQFLLV